MIEYARPTIPRLPGILALALACATIGCAGNRKPAEEAEPGAGEERSTEIEAPAGKPAAPSLFRLVPDSGRAGVDYPVRIVLEGRDFAATGNIVTFGGIPSHPLESTENGTRITYLIPKEIPSVGEVPPEILLPGEYPVTVTTPAGTSKALPFTLTGGA